MSYEIHLQAFRSGQPMGFPSACIVRAFGTFLSERSQEGWVLTYDPATWCQIYATPDAGDELQGLTLSRPCGDPRLWSSLTSLLHEGPFVLYGPGTRAMVGSAESASHLPMDMVEALGGFVVIESPHQIPDEISRS